MDFMSARGAYVVLDATEVHRDWYLSGLEFQLLRFLAREAGLEPRIPASVVAEVTANQAREYARARKVFLKAGAEMRRVGGGAVQLGHAPNQHDYAETLSQRLENLWVEVIDPPSTAHSEIVARAVARRKPFDETGSGYRDTLTWLTCVELARDGGHVFLVSQDKDFAGADLTLAPELAEEVANLPGSVTLVKDLRLWLTPLSPWKGVTDPREAAGLARDEEVAALFAPWDMFEDVHFTALELGLPPGATIHSVEYRGSDGLDRVSHKRNDDGSDSIVYQFTIEFEVELSLRGDEAVEAGFVTDDVDAVSIHDVTTVVLMTCFMTVTHDETDVEGAIYFDSFRFVPGYVYPAIAREDDPDQLRLPFEDVSP